MILLYTVQYLEAVQGRLHEARDLLEDVFLAGVPSEHVVERARDCSARDTSQSREEGGGGTHVMHDRSRMATDPHLPTVSGRSTSGVHRSDRHCLHQARSAARSSGNRMEGALHPALRTVYEADFLAYG